MPESYLKTLLRLIETDPLPAEHTSSHWQYYGSQTRVRYDERGLTLQASGFDVLRPRSVHATVAGAIHRISYRRVTHQLQSFQDIWWEAKRLAGDLGGGVGFHVLKCAAVLSVLEDHWRTQEVRPRTFALIGDGDGFLGALIHRRIPEARVYCIDLPKPLVFQAKTHEQAHGGVTIGMLAAGDRQDVTLVLPGAVEQIEGDIDCAVNVSSMQEMTSKSVTRYFAFLRRRSGPQSHFYCVNRLRKELPGGEVSSFLEYPWSQDDQIFLDGACPFSTHFFAPYTLSNGPRWLGLRIPFVNYFEGATLHRLAHLARAACA